MNYQNTMSQNTLYTEKMSSIKCSFCQNDENIDFQLTNAHISGVVVERFELGITCSCILFYTTR